MTVSRASTPTIFCQKCGSTDLRITSYRYLSLEGVRVRTCGNCGARFITKEIPFMEVDYATIKESDTRSYRGLFESGSGEARVLAKATNLGVRLLGEYAIQTQAGSGDDDTERA